MRNSRFCFSFEATESYLVFLAFLLRPIAGEAVRSSPADLEDQRRCVRHHGDLALQRLGLRGSKRLVAQLGNAGEQGERILRNLRGLRRAGRCNRADSRHPFAGDHYRRPAVGRHHATLRQHNLYSCCSTTVIAQRQLLLNDKQVVGASTSTTPGTTG